MSLRCGEKINKEQQNDQIETFFRSYEYVSQFSVDSVSKEPKDMSNPRDFDFDINTFYREMYVERTDAFKKIWEQALISPNIILLMGERGCGKTSLGLSVVRELEKLGSPAMLVTRYDARREKLVEMISSLSPGEVDIEVNKVLIDKYLSIVFPYRDYAEIDDNGFQENPFLRLLAYIIDPEKVKPIGYGYEIISVKPRNFYWTEKNKPLDDLLDDGRKDWSYYDWLRKRQYIDDDVRSFINQMVYWEGLTLEFLMWAAHDILEYERQCIWIDNVDGFSKDQQVGIQSLARRLEASISQIGTIIVAVRERNVFNEYAFDEMQAPPYETRIVLKSMSVNLFSDGKRVDAWLAPFLNPKELKKIIGKRMALTRKRYLESRRLVHDGSENESLLARGLSSSFYTITDFRKQFYLPLIPKEVMSIIGLMSNKILEAWKPLRIESFCNNSIRLMLDLHFKFLHHMLRFMRKHINIEALEDNKVAITKGDIEGIHTRNLTTHFLSWIRSTQDEKVKVGIYDIIEAKDNWSGIQVVGCNLDYLLLTCVWNLMLSKPYNDTFAYKIPTVKEVIVRLKKLGYKKKRIKEAMYHLFHNETFRTHLIEIQSPSIVNISKSSEIKEDFLVSITPRGRSIIRYITNTYGYFLECLALHHKRVGNVHAILEEYHIKHDDEAVLELMIPQLCEIGDMHIKTLCEFREGSFTGRDWLKKYLTYFGIPLEDNSRIGMRVNSHMRTLQLPALLDGLKKYYRDNNAAYDKLELLEKEYDNAIMTLQDYHDWDKKFIEIFKVEGNQDE